jgi:hypothetical protein
MTKPVMRTLSWFAVLLPTLLSSSSCSRTQGSDAASARALQVAVDSLRERVQDLEYRLSSEGVAMVDCAKPGYDRLTTSLGTFLISCDNAQAYLNGYRLRLRIGNVTSGTYFSPEVAIKWMAGRYDDLLEGAGDSTSGKVGRTTVQLTTDLMPGSWTPIDVVLAPATAEQLNYIEVRLSVDEVSLRRR